MLSVIVASNREENFRRLEQNLVATIGLPYELLRISDVNNGLSACYNRGAARARFSVLCFVHDDVLFHTQAWGAEITDLLQDPNTGVVGSMGGRYKSAFGAGWRDGRTTAYRYLLKDGLEGGKTLCYLPDGAEKSTVLCLDGAFFCCRKEVWERLRFDETTFRGFHFYDIDFSFRAARVLTNRVTGRVLIEHFSHGNFSADYLRDSLAFNKKHAALLPASLDPLTKKERQQLEGYALSKTLGQLKKEGYSVRFRWRLLRRYLQGGFNLYQFVRSAFFGFVK